MTREDFIRILEKEEYPYEIEGNKIVIKKGNRLGNFSLDWITSLPPDVEFSDMRSVYLNSLTSVPPNVIFKNTGDVSLESVTSISSGVEFMNGRSISLDSVRSIHREVVFGIKGNPFLGWWYFEWKGNIKGILNNRILNKMIKDGVFER
jgi:hypothetical protein